MIYFGGQSHFSWQVLHSLLQQQTKPGLLVLWQKPKSDKTIFIKQVSASIVDLAKDHGIAVFYLHEENQAELLAHEQVQGASVALSVCYPKIIRDTIVQAFSKGGFNLHPSFLPQYRGPVPIFWQMRNGLQQIGLSLHRLEQRFDRGAIVAQASMALEDGQSMMEIEERLARIAPDLINGLNGPITDQAQDESQASYQGYPDEKDFELNQNWTAQHMFNFIRASENMGRLHYLKLQQEKLYVQSAQGFESTRLISEDYIKENQVFVLRCSPGVVYCRARLD